MALLVAFTYRVALAVMKAQPLLAGSDAAGAPSHWRLMVGLTVFVPTLTALAVFVAKAARLP